MSEDTSAQIQTDAPDTGTQATEPTGIDSLPEWAQQELRQARKDAANYRTQVRELEPLAEKARAAEDAQKTESQRLQESLTARESELSALRTELTRSRVLKQFGLPDELGEFIAGDEDAMKAAAERLAALTSTQRAGGLRTAPVAALQSGGSAANEEPDFDADALADQILKRKFR
ncbi:hypothetical protein [Kutzneria chonburiensis]|uniref:Scaffolding protein n=1 Tax=Kutzneria chonburiensis TaxID=1483604 RepID=A0ABV6N3M1_9PSEU|nr:hypothetical protein [Kutzneria chonburiensis]